MKLRVLAQRKINSVPATIGNYNHYYCDDNHWRKTLENFINRYITVLTEGEAVKILNCIKLILTDYEEHNGLL
jgi:hypothetical protein